MIKFFKKYPQNNNNLYFLIKFVNFLYSLIYSINIIFSLYDNQCQH